VKRISCAPFHRNERQLRINAFAVTRCRSVNGGVEFRVNIADILSTRSTDSDEVPLFGTNLYETPAIACCNPDNEQDRARANATWCWRTRSFVQLPNAEIPTSIAVPFVDRLFNSLPASCLIQKCLIAGGALHSVKMRRNRFWNRGKCFSRPSLPQISLRTNIP